MIYIGGSNGQVRKFDGTNWSKVVDCSTYSVTALHQLPNGALLAGCSNGKILRLDLGGTAWVEIFDGTNCGGISGIAVAPSGAVRAWVGYPSTSRILTGTTSSMSIWTSVYHNRIGIDPTNESLIIISGSDGLFSAPKIHYSNAGTPSWFEDTSHPSIDGSAPYSNLGWDSSAGQFIHTYIYNYRYRFAVGNVGNWTEVFDCAPGMNGAQSFQYATPCISTNGDYICLFQGDNSSSQIVVRRVNGTWSRTNLSDGVYQGFVGYGNTVSQGDYFYTPITNDSTAQVYKYDGSSLTHFTIALGTAFTAYAAASANGPPELTGSPDSPNSDYYSTRPMVWEVTDLDGTPSVTLLTIGGIPAVVNNVIQSGFSGTVSTAGGVCTVSLLASSNIFKSAPSFSWVINFTDGSLSGSESGTIYKYYSPVDRNQNNAQSIKYHWSIGDSKDLDIDSGMVVRDTSIISEVRFRLTCRRGQWWVDKKIGSRLHEIKTSKNAKTRVAQYVKEALAEMLRDKRISSISVEDVSFDSKTGSMYIAIVIETPDGEKAQIREVISDRS